MVAIKPSFHNWSGDRRLKSLVFLVLLLLAVAFVAYSYLTFKQAKYVYGSPTTISVRGVGEVIQKPDIAKFSFGVYAVDKDSTVAQKNVTEASNNVLSYLKEEGIAEKDIKTLSYNLSRKDEHPVAPCEANLCPPSVSQFVGYAVNQTVAIKVRDITKAGDLLSGVGYHGASNVSGLTFTIDDDTSAKAEARAKAVADAKKKAQQLADTLGVRLVRLTSFYEEDNGVQYPMDDKGYTGEMTATVTPVAPQVPAGENTISSAVNLTYEIE